MKKLPIGIQTFSEIRNGEYIYVDKTKSIAELIEGKYYFLSRPRRFGKSLLVDTLKQIFLGNKELFKGLWIENQIDWQAYPVIHIDFSGTGYKSSGLPEAISGMMEREATRHGIHLAEQTYDQKFRELVVKLSEKGQVVVLIDEYDKPVIDYLDNIPQAVENREILKTFYSPVKPLDPYLKFVLITGVSKFSHISIFSDLNNLRDITVSPQFAELLGITFEEILRYFDEYLVKWEKQFGSRGTLLESIQHWYNGYSWDGMNFVYNPFSLINFFADGQFSNYWFRTGTPTFLTKLVKTGNFNVPEFEQLVTTSSVLDKFEIENIELAGILFQTGYLTIKKKEGEYYILGYPNHEVRQSWFEHLLAMLNDARIQSNNSILWRMKAALTEGQTETFMLLLKEIFAGLTYQQIERKESYFHSIFYLTVKLLGMEIESEVLTSFGRIDVVIKTRDYIYITEFKLGTAMEALEQIRKIRYAEKYAGSGKQIILLGIGFDADQRTIGSWEDAAIY